MIDRPYDDRATAGRVLAREILAALERGQLDHGEGDHGLLDRGQDDHDQGDHARAGQGHADGPRVVVLALPRGGVPVGVPVAAALGVPLDVLVVRKLGAPGQPELAVGAIAAVGEGVQRVLNPGWVRRLRLSDRALDSLEAAETRELRDRVDRFGAAPPVEDRTVVVVDDGLATGATMRAAVTAVRQAGAAVVVAAAPVGATVACRELEQLADLVVCPRRPDPFRAVGEHYRDFDQLSDAEVLTLLR